MTTDVAPVPVYKDRDFYVPAFEIRIRDQGIPGDVIRDVMEVRYIDNVEEIDSFEITVNNWDAETQDFKYTGGTRKNNITGDTKKRSELFDPGQEIELRMGYFKPMKDGSNPLQMMLIGKITKLTPNFPASGIPTLKVSGQNVLRQFKTKQESHDYVNKKDSEIAEAIGKRGNLRYKGDPIAIVINCNAQSQEQPNEHLSQINQFDILFLMQLARRNSYDLLFIPKDEDNRIRNLTGCPGKLPKPPFLYFGPSTNLLPVSYLLEWGKSLVQFQPTLSTTNQVSQVTVRGWDVLQKKPIKVTKKRSDLATRPLRDKKRLEKLEKEFDEHREIVVDKPFRSAKEAEKFARSLLENNAKNMVTGRGTTIGLPDLRAGSFIEIAGLGTTFNGRYFVKSTTHTIGTSGYTTEFDARLEEKNV